MRLRADARPGPDQVVVDRSEILGHVAGFRPATATDRTRDEGRVAKAIERLVTARILLKTTDPDRFRVASVVEVLLPLERLLELDTWLRTNASRPDETTDGATTDDATADGEPTTDEDATTPDGAPIDEDDPRLQADETDTDDEGETDA